MSETMDNPPVFSPATGRDSTSFVEVEFKSPGVQPTEASPTGANGAAPSWPPPTKSSVQPGFAAPFASAGLVTPADAARMDAYKTQQLGNLTAGAAAGAQAADSHMTREWERLRMMETELNKREKTLRQREMEVGRLGNRPANFPKHCYCIKPQVYHDISADMTPPRQPFMRALYINFYITCLLLVLQTATALVALVADGADDVSGDDPPYAEHFGVSILYLIGIVFAFPLWYWPVYQALSSRNSNRYTAGFIGLGIATLFNAVMVLGIVGHGGAGVLFTMSVLDRKDSAFLDVLGVICLLGWALQLLFFIFSFYRYRTFYREDLLRSLLPEVSRNTQMQAAVLEAGLQSVMPRTGGVPPQQRTA
ncbi:secretory carrier membrane protein 3 [Diplonema papillatum]|nr:secretory carrier membrane protein 3 [Diplonema papillatum]